MRGCGEHPHARMLELNLEGQKGLTYGVEQSVPGRKQQFKGTEATRRRPENGGGGGR